MIDAIVSVFECVDHKEFLTFFLMIIQTNPEADSTSFPSINSKRMVIVFYFLGLFSFFNLYWDVDISGMSCIFVTKRNNISTPVNSQERKVLTETWLPWYAFGLGKKMFLQLSLQLPTSGPTRRMIWFSFSLNEWTAKERYLVCSVPFRGLQTRMIRCEILERCAKLVLLQLANIFAITSDLLIPTKHRTPLREKSCMSLANKIKFYSESHVEMGHRKWAGRWGTR